MKANEFLTENWSQKYKKSINCSHPKGFSQKAHCAGKKKHNEDITMEMTCPDCGMCQTHSNLNEIKKGAKDSNGVTKCWSGYHAAGTKKSATTGKQVRNCVPNESVAEDEKHGLYYNVNNRKKAGTSRDASSPKAPTAQAWKDAAKTAKKESVTESKTYKLWESAGRSIVEAQLTAAQIQQIFQQAEQGATASGTNRTGLGKAKDAGSAVAQAWEQLKTKVANSGPIKNVDAYYDQAAEKLKQATGGDAGIMQYVQKYRTFAKAHPVAQSLIYAALIAAAGISGVGAGGAAALALFKMVDKLLQGEKFSSAAYSGAKTGALAYGASLLKDLMSGTQGVTTSVEDPEWEKLRFQGDLVSVNQVVTTTNGTDTFKEVIQSIVGPNDKGEYLVRIVNNDDLREFVTKTPPPSVASGTTESKKYSKSKLTETQIKRVFYDAGRMQDQLNEGMLDNIKNTAKGLANKAAGAVVNKAQTIGTNLTTKVTADKLMTAWKKAGSPLDSEQVKAIMKQSGVADNIITATMPTQTTTAPAQGVTASNPTQPMPANEDVENMMDELDRILELSTGISVSERAELGEEFDLIESIIDSLAERNNVDAEVIWEDLESLTDDELYVFATTTPVNEDWQKANKKDKTDGMSKKAVNAYRREHPGSKLKTAVTTKPSKLKKGSKASKRRKSYCSRSKGQMKMHSISCAKTPDKAICKARRRWNC
jgi:hypothetical protein